jgi:ketosteroid isomerase-like protein
MEASSQTQQRNIELTRRGFKAYNAGDYETLAAVLDPDVELHSDDELINGGDYRGRESFMQWSAEWLEAWDEFRVEARSLETFGDHCILADSHQVARGAGSGVVVEMDVFWAFEVAAGTVRRMHLYASRDRALEAICRWRAQRDTDSPA